MLKKLVGERGFEPPTPWSRTWGQGADFVNIQSFEWCFNRTNSRHSCSTLPVIFLWVPRSGCPKPKGQVTVHTPSCVETQFSDCPSLGRNPKRLAPRTKKLDASRVHLARSTTDPTPAYK